jgi:hypothetical protein
MKYDVNSILSLEGATLGRNAHKRKTETALPRQCCKSPFPKKTTRLLRTTNHMYTFRTLAVLAEPAARVELASGVQRSSQKVERSPSHAVSTHVMINGTQRETT